MDAAVNAIERRDGSRRSGRRNEPLADQAARWLLGLRRYLVASALGHLVWELLHLPLYADWMLETRLETALFLARCIAGDVLIALSALVVALLGLGAERWPRERFRAVAVLTILVGVVYTAFSEWVHVQVLDTWTYAAVIPTLPVIGTGLSPLAQWLVIPAFALWWARVVPGARA